MKTIAFLLFFINSVFMGFTSLTHAQESVSFAAPQQIRILSGDQAYPFTIELADTEKRRSYGLMERKDLAPDAGMLFDFSPQRHVSMWMERTLIPLDIIFIDKKGVIVKIERSAKPLSRRDISSDRPVLAVLEIPGGRAAELNIQPGDRVQHALFNNVGIEHKKAIESKKAIE